MSDITFGMALAALREGKKVRRPHWDSDIYYKEVTFNGFEPCLVEYQIDQDTFQEVRHPGIDVKYTDLLANDWEVVT